MYRKMGASLRGGIGQQLISDEPSQPAKQYCAIKPGMCITEESKRYLNSLNCRIPQAKGFSRGGLRGLGASTNSICSMYNRLQPWLLKTNFDACEVKRANLPLCAPVSPNSPGTPFQPLDVPPEEAEDDDDANMYMVGGILAVLVVGGVGYAVFKNRKKGKKRKKR